MLGEYKNPRKVNYWTLVGGGGTAAIWPSLGSQTRVKIEGRNTEVVECLAPSFVRERLRTHDAGRARRATRGLDSTLHHARIQRGGWCALHCAHHATTVLSWGLCEHRDHTSCLAISLLFVRMNVDDLSRVIHFDRDLSADSDIPEHPALGSEAKTSLPSRRRQRHLGLAIINR